MTDRPTLGTKALDLARRTGLAGDWRTPLGNATGLADCATVAEVDTYLRAHGLSAMHAGSVIESLYFGD